MINRLSDLLPDQFLPEKVCAFYGEISSWGYNDLLELEKQFISSAVQSRQQEFAAGRAIARAALNELNFDNIPIAVGKFREPLWPQSIVGSITHQHPICAVVISDSDNIAGIGIDLVTDDVLDAELINLICSEKEIAHLQGLTNLLSLDLFKLVFSIKESIYKCLYPQVGQFFDFKDVDVFVNASNKTASISLKNADLFQSLPAEYELTIKFCKVLEFLFSAAILKIPGSDD